MRSIRRSVDIALPIVGIVLVLGAVVFIWWSMYLQLAVVVLGIFLIEAGIWKLAHPLLPSVRRYGALREEVDDFIYLVRRLNAAAVARDTGADEGNTHVAAVRQEMIDAIDRMVGYAGRELPTRPEDGAASDEGTPLASDGTPQVAPRPS